MSKVINQQKQNKTKLFISKHKQNEISLTSACLENDEDKRRKKQLGTQKTHKA